MLILLKSLTKLLNLAVEGKVRKQLISFLVVKHIALAKIDGGLRSIAIGNTLRHIASECAGRKALQREFFLGVFNYNVVLEEELNCGILI